MKLTFRTLLDTRFDLGESPVWDDRADALLFCDIYQGAIHRVAMPGRAVTVWRFDSPVGSFGLCRSGRLVVALRDRVGLFDPETGAFTTLAEIEADKPETRLNDGKVGPDGAFWVGTMDDRPERKPIGALYRVDGKGRVERKADGIHVSNGLAFAPDGRALYHSDSTACWIDRWKLDPASGAISDRHRFATLDPEEGRPDGGAVDVEGCYWSAGVRGARLKRFAPDGTLRESHDIPALWPTMPCFGGQDRRTLFVTSLRRGQSEADLARWPLAGCVFEADAPVAGLPANRFDDG